MQFIINANIRHYVRRIVWRNRCGAVHLFKQGDASGGLNLFIVGLHAAHGELRLSKLFDTAAAGTRMVSVGDAVAEYRKHFARRACMHPAEPPHVILEFMPKLKRTYPWLLFTVDSLLGIKYSYSFSFVRNDVRRRTLHGREDATVLTGLDFRNHRITRQACTVRDRASPS